MPQVIFYQLSASDNGVTGKASEVVANAVSYTHLTLPTTPYV